MLTIPIQTLTLGLEAFGLSFALAALMAAPIMALLRKLKSRQIIDDYAPETHKAKAGTPTMGGLIVLAGLVPALVVNALSNGKPIYLIIGMVCAFAAIGLIDDYVVPRMKDGKRGLGWLLKLVLQTSAAVLAPAALGLPPHWLTWSACILFILFFANAFNFADGLDGLAGGIGIVFGIGLTIVLAIALPLANLAPTMAIVGALIPFLLINAPPAKVFMGDVGSLPIGALFGLMAFAPLREIVYATSDPVAHALEDHSLILAPSAVILPILVLSLLMIIELVPVPLQVAYYKLTKGKRLFPMTPIHHAFEKKGWPETRIVFAFVMAQVLFAVVAVYIALRAYPVPSGG